MRSKLEVAPGGLDDGARDEHLAAGGARGHARGEVDLAPVVVAVAVERPRRRGSRSAAAGARSMQRLEADRPVGERAGVGADDHHLVADRLDDPRVVGQRALDLLDEALDGADGLLVALLLGQPRVAGEVGEGDRDAQAPEVERSPSPRSASMWPMTSCSTKCAQVAAVHAVHHRRGERQQLADQLLHLLGDLARRRRRRASAARGRRGGTAAPRRRRSARAPGRRPAAAAGTRRAGSRPRDGARDVGEQHDVVRREPRLTPGARRGSPSP